MGYSGRIKISIRTITNGKSKSNESVMEEIGNQITEVFQEKSEVLLTIWGWEEPARGHIILMGSRTGTVHVQQSDATIKVKFMDIMRVDYSRE